MPFGGDTEGTVPDLTDVLIAIAAIESRILRLVRDGAGEIPAEELTNELPRLSGDLVRLYRRLADLSDRRDLSYATQRKLHRLQDQCVWLYRKAHNELSFFKKLGLEARLRALVSEDAFNVYQQLLCAEDEERRLAAHDDTALAACLLAEPEAG